MSEYIITENGLLPTDELMHYAKGQTKRNAKYVSKRLVNGKWVYTYKKSGPGGTPNSSDIDRHQKYADAQGDYGYAKMYSGARQQNQSAAESMKRMQSSAQRNVEKSLSYRIRSKKAYYVNKAKNFLKKFTVPLRYGKRVTADIAVSEAKVPSKRVIAFGRKGQNWDTKQQRYVNLGSNFVKKYGL